MASLRSLVRRLEGSPVLEALRPLPPYACGARKRRKGRDNLHRGAQLPPARTCCLIGLVPAAGSSYEAVVAECEAAAHELEESLVVRARTDGAIGSAEGGVDGASASGWYHIRMGLQRQLLTAKELKAAYVV